MLDGIALSIELTRLLGYYRLSGKLIGSLHIHASHTWLLCICCCCNTVPGCPTMLCIHLVDIIGASAAKPHMDDTSWIFRIYVMRKVWIGTIRRLSCAIYGSTNCAIICGLRTQSMDCTVRKVWIETIHGLFCANYGSPWIVHTCLAQRDLTACIKR